MTDDAHAHDRHDHRDGGTFAGHGRAEVVDPAELVSVETYREHTLGRLPAAEAIELRLSDVLGLVLAEDVLAGEPVPSFANSAMDGYAVQAADVAGATEDEPARLEVVGEIAAGATELPSVGTGEAVRIMTGAPLPNGADTVVPVEVTRKLGVQVSVHRPGPPGEYVRTVGQDVKAGQGLLRAGHRIRPADIGMLAAVGRSRVTCYPPPRVVIITTGDELVPPEQQPGPGHIRDANGPMLTALIRQAGAVPFNAGIIPDDRQALHDAFDSNLGHADLVVASGGISAGAYDLVRDVVANLGEAEHFKVAMKPGMPQTFGTIDGVPVFALPGNPVSTFVSFEVFVRPALRALQGRKDIARPLVEATLSEPVSSPPHKRSWLRVRLKRQDGRWYASPTGHQGSHVITSIVKADGLAEIPEDETSLPAGSPVRVHLLVES